MAVKLSHGFGWTYIGIDDAKHVVEDRPLLICDDIIGTGQTMLKARKCVTTRLGAKYVAAVVLYQQQVNDLGHLPVFYATSNPTHWIKFPWEKDDCGQKKQGTF